MKKNTLLFVVACITIGAYAQPASRKIVKMNGIMNLQNVKSVQKSEIYLLMSKNNILPMHKIASALDTTYYLKPEGSFYGGFYANGYSTYPRIIPPAIEKLTYINISSNMENNTWKEGTAEPTNSIDFETSYGFGAYYLPTLKTKNGAMYTYGDSYPENNMVLSGLNEPIPLTNCGMYTSTAFNEDGFDCYQIGTGSDDAPYAYGTDLRYDNKGLDSIGVFFNNISTMYVDTVFLPIYNQSATSPLIPVGATLTLTAYALNITEAGFQLTDKVLAVATATATDVTSHEVYSNSQSQILSFVFKKTNALGISTSKPAIFNGPFYLELTGYNESNCDFGILADYYNPAQGTTYFRYGGSLSQFWKHGSNLAMSLNAIIPALSSDTTDVNYSAPAVGGIAVNNSGDNPGVYATFAPNDKLGIWTYEGLPEWLTVSTDDAYFVDHNYVGINFTAEALPAGISGRSANITITSLGKSLTYQISQGKVTEINVLDVSDVMVLRRADSYEISEADQYSSVELINLAGQVIDSYRINGSSVLIIPVASLTSGVYMLKFYGTKNTSTKKIII